MSEIFDNFLGAKADPVPPHIEWKEGPRTPETWMPGPPSATVQMRPLSAPHYYAVTDKPAVVRDDWEPLPSPESPRPIEIDNGITRLRQTYRAAPALYDSVADLRAKGLIR